jgi:hypothetical protein
MKRFFASCSALAFIMLPLFVGNCEYDDKAILPSSNIILHDQSLEVIRVNVQGHWKLLFTTGGLAGGIYPAKNNAYMNITGDHIVYGDDSLGVTLDAVIVWKRDQDIIYGGYTYLMSYGALYEIVDRIENDTLIIIDDAYDPDYLYYLKTR